MFSYSVCYPLLTLFLFPSLLLQKHSACRWTRRSSLRHMVHRRTRGGFSENQQRTKPHPLRRRTDTHQGEHNNHCGPIVEDDDEEEESTGGGGFFYLSFSLHRVRQKQSSNRKGPALDEEIIYFMPAYRLFPCLSVHMSVHPSVYRGGLFSYFLMRTEGQGD